MALKNFLTHEIVEKQLEEACLIALWDFSPALGDTITEKGESLVVRLASLTNELVLKGVCGYFWLATSPEITTMLEGGNFNPTEINILPLGIETIHFAGILNRRWQIWIDPKIANDTILISAGENNKSASLKVINFLV